VSCFQDYAGVPNRLLRKAVSVAAKDLRARGRRDRVVRLHRDAARPVAPSGCGGEVRPTSLYIQFFPQRMAKAVPVRRSIFGYAAPSTPQRFSNRAALFWDRIQDHCEAFALDPDALLGIALAHEIGHLLLGPRGHASRGMMRCPWTKEDIVNAARGRLQFDERELRHLRAGALARMRAAIP
jgi:hypothetical protein